MTLEEQRLIDAVAEAIRGKRVIDPFRYRKEAVRALGAIVAVTDLTVDEIMARRRPTSAPEAGKIRPGRRVGSH